MERKGGLITPGLTGHAVATAWTAVGLAAAGRLEEAEPLAMQAMSRNRSLSGAIATWAQVLIYDAQGRIAEGISACANYDGTVNFEGAGLYLFESRLGGYGARFSLDREERGRGKSAALRLFERHFERVLGYSGYEHGRAWDRPMQQAPLAWKEESVLALEEGTDKKKPTLFESLLGQSKVAKETEKEYFEIVLKDGRVPSTKLHNWRPSLEDVLTWLPPSPQQLTDATLLLLRFTLNGTVSNRNVRWDAIRNGWKVHLDFERKHDGQLHFYYPLASIAASLLVNPSETGGDQISNGEWAAGLWLMGETLGFGDPQTEDEKSTSIREQIAERNPNFWLPAKVDEADVWKRVVDHFSDAFDGVDSGDGSCYRDLQWEHWEFEARPIVEHAVVYACCKAGDIESLSLARTICSQGVTLRPNSPETWWRYSIVLGLLGDQVASEDALNNSIQFGGGQGARV